MSVVCELQEKLDRLLGPSGFESHPFKVDWYNQHVKQGFQLDAHGDALAFVIISTPTFFEKCFIPFVCHNVATNRSQDLLDQSISHCLTAAVKSFPDQTVSVLHDYEMRPGTRRPKVLVQTAGHVSGAVHFYQKNDVQNPPWSSDEHIFGVCLHPKYIGWFALRAVIIFHDVLVPDLVQKVPKDILQDDARKIELLNRYNRNWEDWTFRDILEPVERYSELQRQYFGTKPGERGPIIDMIKKEYSSISNG